MKNAFIASFVRYFVFALFDIKFLIHFRPGRRYSSVGQLCKKTAYVYEFDCVDLPNYAIKLFHTDCSQ